MTQLQQAFQQDGFAAARGFLSHEHITEVLENTQRFQRQRLRPSHVLPTLPREHLFYEDKSDASTLKQIQHLEAHDGWFEQLISQGPFHQLAETLLDSPAIPMNLQYFNKPPTQSKPTPPHQDGYYFMLEPCKALTMWLALDDVDEENGCVRYVRGSHRQGMRTHHRTQTLGFSQGIKDFPLEQDLAQEVAVKAKPGDLLVHDALTIHWAQANQSADRQRRALGFIYYSVDAKQDRAAHEAYQKQLASEHREDGVI